MGAGMAKRDKAPGNCHCCSAIFIRSREQSSMKALQIAYPSRSIRPSLGTMVWGGGERTHKFSLFYSQRLVYIRNKRGKREKERETVLGWSKQRRENTGEETQRRTNVSWRGRKPRREARARGHLPLSPLSLSLVRSTFAQPYRPPFKSSLFPVALNFPPWKTSLVEGNRTF